MSRPIERVFRHARRRIKPPPATDARALPLPLPEPVARPVPVARARRAAVVRKRALGVERRSLGWLVAGDRSPAFGRSLALACIGAVVWAIGLHLAETPLLRQGALAPAVAERLLLEVDNAGSRRLAALARRLPTHWTASAETRRIVRLAADDVGIDPGYLLAVAALESSFDPTARAAGTTARGLYQFTEDTWLRVVKVFGVKHGLADFAAAIVVAADGGVSLPDAALRKTLLELRNDAAVAAVMAAELALDNKSRLERLLGRPVSTGEIYLAHFLGLTSAAHMIEAAYARPQVPAAHVVPAAAVTNPGVFGPASDPVSAGAIVARIEAYFRDDVPRLAST
jgi:soluble lytic murein transglycosylase-like protein